MADVQPAPFPLHLQVSGTFPMQQGGIEAVRTCSSMLGFDCLQISPAHTTIASGKVGAGAAGGAGSYSVMDICTYFPERCVHSTTAPTTRTGTQPAVMSELTCLSGTHCCDATICIGGSSPAAAKPAFLPGLVAPGPSSPGHAQGATPCATIDPAAQPPAEATPAAAAPAAGSVECSSGWGDEVWEALDAHVLLTGYAGWECDLEVDVRETGEGGAGHGRAGRGSRNSKAAAVADAVAGPMAALWAMAANNMAKAAADGCTRVTGAPGTQVRGFGSA